jgi:hypothetical protein
MEPKRVPIRVQHSILARPQVGTTWGYWGRTCFRKDVRYNKGNALGNTETNTSALKGRDIVYALMFGPYIPPFQG